MNCNEGPRSRFPSRIFFDAMLRNLDLWVRYGIAPPHADPIDVRERRAGVLDEFGNVVGRPALALPRRADEHVVRQLDRRLVLLHRRPRGAVRRGDACSSSTRRHGAYVRAVVKDTARLVAGRYITGYDGLDLIREAAQADVP